MGRRGRDVTHTHPRVDVPERGGVLQPNTTHVDEGVEQREA